MLLDRSLRTKALCAFMIISSLGSYARADEPTGAAYLADDPSYQRGVFTNGLNYTIRKHPVPPGRVALYLHVRSGSLNETPEQNGLAHFLEHMAFNGSKHFEPGTLLPKLSSLGMEFGVHSNAHTSTRETVYKLTMPDTKPETIDLALTVLSDFADGLLLTPEQIEAERGVVLEELRMREGAARRLRTTMMTSLYPDAQLTLHDTLGSADVIRNAKREEFADYWNTWYRPENMTLIVVGDVEPAAIIDAAQAKLGMFKARAIAQRETPAGLAKFAEAPDRAFVLSDPEIVTAQVSMTAVTPVRAAVRTLEQYRAQEVTDLGVWMLNRRLDDRVRSGQAAYQRAGLSISDAERDATLITAAATGRPEDWQAMLAGVIAEIARAASGGFSDDELARAKAEWKNTAKTSADGMETVNASAIIDTVSGSITDDELLISAGQRVALLDQLLDGIQPAEVAAAFKSAYVGRHYSYVLALPRSDAALPSGESVLAAAALAFERSVDGPTTSPAPVPLLASIPIASAEVARDIDAELGVTTVRFANGAVLHHKFNDYQRHNVIVRLTFPGGRIEETAANKGVSAAASAMFARTATSRLDSSAVRNLLTGKSVAVGGTIGLDALTLQINGTPGELETGLQLAYAIITDGRLETAALADWKKASLQAIESERTDPGSAVRKLMEHSIYGNDPRLTRLAGEDVRRQELSAVEAWVHRIVSTAPVEVAVVGDIPADRAVELIGRYVGSLPRRDQSFDALDPLRTLDRAKGPYELRATFDSVAPTAVAVAGFLGCDVRNTPDRRALTLAARVLTERMTKRLREDEQLVYSISCTSSPAISIPGTGAVSAGATTDPAKVDRLASEIVTMMKEFAASGPSEAELAVAKRQERTEREVSMREPQFWVSVLADLVYRKRPLTEVKDSLASFDAVTVAQVRETMNRYLTADSTIRITAVPNAPGATNKVGAATTRP